MRWVNDKGRLIHCRGSAFNPLLSRVLTIMVLLCPLLVVADVVIELSDGRQIVVPVDREDVARISFESTGPVETTRVMGGPDTGTPEEEAMADSTASTWRVGAGYELKSPSDAARVARDGDTVEIAAGVYRNDYVKWTQNDLTIRGVGGMAHLKSQGLIRNGKAIWIVKGNNTLIENIEFSGAAVKDANGAGIRHEGGDLVLRNTFFHHNEFSILTGARPGVHVQVLSSRFWFQRRQNRFSHGIYIGKVARFTLQGSHFKGTDEGQQVKSRALENRILYNRIEDVPQGNSSRLIDLSNCGLSFIVGNDLHQAASSENLNAIGYGAEGCDNRTAAQKRLFVINNTFVNEARGGSLVRNMGGGDVLVSNNLLFGKGDMLQGDGVENNNLRVPLGSRQKNSWSPPGGSAAVNGALALSGQQGVSVVPVLEFNPPAGTRKRAVDGSLDIGSRESAR